MSQVAVAGGSVAFNELVGLPKLSRRISANRKKRGETRHGIIRWVDIDALLLECLPAPPALPGIHPRVGYLHVDSVDIMPWPPNPGTNGFSYNGLIVDYVEAIVAIKYSPLPYDSSTLITRKSTYSAEVQLQPASGIKWQDTDDPVKSSDTQVGKVVPMVDHTFEFHRVAPNREGPLDSVVRSLVGMVNTSTYSGIPAETLLFKGASKTWTIDSTGNQTFTYGMQFKERSLKDDTDAWGWNHFYRNEDGKYARILTKEGNLMYATTNQFSNLFQI